MKINQKLVVLVALGTAVASAFLSTPASAALKVGTQAPDFTANAWLAGEPFEFTLSDALNKGPMVVYFFPAPHTSGCNIEARLFSESIDQFKAEGAAVIGVTAGKLDELADFSKETEHCGGKFPVAADPDAKIAKQYDSVLMLKPGWSDRTSYVIDRSGKIVHVYSDLSPKLHVKQTLDAVKALKNTNDSLEAGLPTANAR